MKHFLINLLGELPVLLVLAACYIIMDRTMFGNRLSKIIRSGMASEVRRRLNRKGVPLPLRPVDSREILTTVAFDKGMTGHTGALSAEPKNNRDGSDSFASESECNAVVSPEEYDRVFADSRVEIVRTGNDDQEWINPVSAEDTNTGSAYRYPDDYDETEDDGYNEMSAAFGDLREVKQRLKERIRSAVRENFADVRKENRPVDGFDIGVYK